MRTRTKTKTRPSWRVFVFCAVLVLAPGCHIKPRNAQAIAPTRDFNALSCEQLEVESKRITAEYLRLQQTRKPGTRDAIGRLNGETFAVNDAIRINGCKISSVRVPGSPVTEKNSGYR